VLYPGGSQLPVTGLEVCNKESYQYRCHAEGQRERNKTLQWLQLDNVKALRCLSLALFTQIWFGF